MELAASDRAFVEQLAERGGLPFDYVLGTVTRDGAVENGRLVAVSLSSYEGAAIDLRPLDALVKVRIAGERLASVTLGAPTKLESLTLTSPRLASIDVSGCAALTSLDLSRCKLTKVPALPPRLAKLALADNPLGRCDVASKTLEWLDVTRCQLQALDVSALRGLRRLDCAFNAIAELDLRKHDRLETLWCQANGAEVKLPPRAPLTCLSIGKNPRKKLDASVFPSLKTLFVNGTGLSALTLANPVLEHLDCSGNELTTLDLTAAPALRIVTAQTNAFRSLDVRALAKLDELAIDAAVEVRCSDLQKNVLPALRERFGLPKPTKTIAKMDLYQLHSFVAKYNWDDGPKALLEVVRHPACTLATALLVYWQSEPAELAAHETPKAAPRSERAWVELLREIEAGVAEKRFARGPLGFDVHDVGGVDLSDSHPGIPRAMRQVVKAQATSPGVSRRPRQR